MQTDELFEEAERIKLRFVASMERLLRQGIITEQQFNEVVDCIDQIDDFSEEEIKGRLGEVIKSVQERTKAL